MKTLENKNLTLIMFSQKVYNSQSSFVFLYSQVGTQHMEEVDILWAWLQKAKRSNGHHCRNFSSVNSNFSEILSTSCYTWHYLAVE